MSLRAMRWAMEQRVSSGAKLVLIILADRAGNDGRGCTLSQGEIAASASMGERTVREHLVALEDAKLIERDRRHRRDGSRTSDDYTLNLPADSAGSQAADFAGSTPLAADLAGSEPSLPAKSAGLVPTVLEPELLPPLSPVGGPRTNGRTQAGRKHPLPGGWTPKEDHRAIGRERGVDVDAEAEKMRDWAAANAARKVDWDATFRNWLRNAKPEPKRTNGNGNGIHLRPAELLALVPEGVPEGKTRNQIEHEARLLRRAANGGGG